MIEARTGKTERRRIVVAHDWLCGLRGGEHVLERICALVERDFVPAGLLVMFDDRRGIGPTVDAWRDRGLARASWLNSLPAGRDLRRWLLPLYPAGVAHLGRVLERIHAQSPVDLVISTSSAAIKGLRTPAGVPHLCYCHSPARYVWSRKSDYAGSPGAGGRLRAAGLGLFGGAFKRWDRRTASNVTRFVANSTHTAAQIKECYGADSAVIHPPVRTEFFIPDASVPRQDFWLIVSALEPYKKIDVAIRAAKAAGTRLVIAGTGSQAESLRRLAAEVGSAVEFRGRIADAELLGLYRSARVLLFPQVEDFGIVAVEAQACGLPVAARNEGGALDSVIEGVSGSFFSGDSADALAAAAKRAASCSAAACRTNAERFSEATFDRLISAEISRLLRY